MSKINPRTTVKWATRAVFATGPLAAMLLVAYAFSWPPLMERPHLVVMTFMLLMGTATTAGGVAVVAATNIGITKAFGAGYMAGVQKATGDQDGPQDRPGLRVVE